jgi:hypothetical protein
MSAREIRCIVLAGALLAGCNSGSDGGGGGGGAGGSAVDAAHGADAAGGTPRADASAASDAGPAADAAPQADAAPPPAPEWEAGCWHPDHAEYVMDCTLVCHKLLDVCHDDVSDCEQTCVRLSWFLPEASARAVESCLLDDLACGSAFPFLECGANVTRARQDLYGEGNLQRCQDTAAWLRDHDCMDADGNDLADDADARCQLLVPIALPEVSQRQLACTQAGTCADYAACDANAVCSF